MTKEEFRELVEKHIFALYPINEENEIPIYGIDNLYEAIEEITP